MIGGNRYNWIRLAFKGENDNKTGIGTKVELSAGALQQKWEVTGASGYLGQGPAPIVAGLGVEREADVIRLLWPTGVLQDELEIPAHKKNCITEIDRRGSSCPIVFVWNGDKFEFLADMIGPGIVGHWTGPNQRNIPDPAEYFKVIPAHQVQPQEGRHQFPHARADGRARLSRPGAPCSPSIIRGRRGLSQRAFRERSAFPAIQSDRQPATRICP